MEIELKYLIEDEETQKKLWDPSVFGKYGEVDLHAETNMRAVYYDTEDGLLRSVDAAFRIRKENDRYVATLKWGGTSDEALHEREELNLPLCEKSDAEEPSLKVFAESEKGRELIELAGGTGNSFRRWRPVLPAGPCGSIRERPSVKRLWIREKLLPQAATRISENWSWSSFPEMWRISKRSGGIWQRNFLFVRESYRNTQGGSNCIRKTRKGA